MVQKKGRRKLFTVLAVIGAILLIIGIVAVVRALSSNEPTTSTETTKKDTPAVSDEAKSTDKPDTETPEKTPPEAAVDPARVTTVNIDPMAITVSYIKGIGGFDFEVKRTPNGTKFVTFSSTKLVGTKCTNDTGEFASIIDSPGANETATLAKTTVVDGMTYGLSLADETCTPDTALLKQYQDSFSQAFTLLKKM